MLVSVETNCWWQRLGIRDTIFDLGRTHESQGRSEFQKEWPVRLLLGQSLKHEENEQKDSSIESAGTWPPGMRWAFSSLMKVNAEETLTRYWFVYTQRS